MLRRQPWHQPVLGSITQIETQGDGGAAVDMPLS
jgi:hypothetical protein